MNPTNSTIQPQPKRCRACNQFELSKLARYGYCKAGRDSTQRARLLWDGTVCLFLTEWSAHHA